MDIYKSASGKEAVLGRYDEILNLWPVANSQYKVETNFGSTFIIESGSKSAPPLILLHGSTSNSFAWIGDVTKLAETHRVFAVDIIGEAGFSDPARPGYETGAYAQWLSEVLDQLNLEKVSVVGLSLGGWMALNLATTYPERIENLVLLCPGGLARESAGFLVKAVLFSLLGEWGNRKTMEMVYGGKVPNKEGLNQALSYTSLIGKHFKPRMAKLPLFSDLSIRRLTMPVCMVFGERDVLIPPVKSIERLKGSASHAKTVLLPGTGHVVVDQADRIARFLQVPAAERPQVPT